MRFLIISAILIAIMAPSSPILAQNEPESVVSLALRANALDTAKEPKNSLRMDINTVLDSETFFDRLFGFFESQPLVQESADKITQEGAFDDANEAIGEKIGVNPVDILKAFVRTIIWILESGVAFFSNLVN